MLEETWRSRVVIPAQPGWHKVLYIESDNGGAGELASYPVIAWAIDATEYNDGSYHTYAHPIVADGDSGNRYAIKGPTGPFVVPFNCDCETEANLLAYFSKTKV